MRASANTLLRRGGLLALTLFAGAAQAAACPWPAWQAFKGHYLSADGRVIDTTSERQHTVSEGQAYALFFALVANDREAFDRVLRWTEDNLAAGDLTQRLPAWIWGRRDDGSWGVVDANPASDADLWIAYTLAEAAVLWQERRYRVLAQLVGRNLLRMETARLPGLGPSLLPAPVGFVESPTRWRLNPSYAPLQLLRGLALRQPDAGWAALVPGTRRLLLDSAPRGYVPDWVLYDAEGGFLPDTKTSAVGSYDAIRAYLWAGMLHVDDPDRAALLKAYTPMADATAVNGAPPERVDTRSGAASGTGYAGYSAALLPFLAALDRPTALDAQRTRIAARAPQRHGDAYYENVLDLFGSGWDQRRYRFAANGSLHPGWQESACAASS